MSRYLEQEKLPIKGQCNFILKIQRNPSPCTLKWEDEYPQNYLHISSSDPKYYKELLFKVAQAFKENRSPQGLPEPANTKPLNNKDKKSS